LSVDFKAIVKPTAQSSAYASFDYQALVDSGTLVVDTRNALKQRQGPTIFRL
jgi:hypothetical protein